MTAAVAVIITARNAAATIADAVVSALNEPEVGEVVVVDDASTDATDEEARRAGAGDRRLVILRAPQNIGPAAARNLAISRSTSPFVSILDADDYLLPGRFRALLSEPDWDVIADNIAFVPDTRPGRISVESLPHHLGDSERLSLAAFVRGNIPARHVQRGELGFLKPMFRRSVLAAQTPVYDPALWLGEDYDLYVRLLIAGARFRLSRRVGYVARVRQGSLSGQHRTADLQALLQATQRHLQMDGVSEDAKSAMHDHQRQLRARYLLRACLDRKAQQGAIAAAAFALWPPTNFVPIARGVLADKLSARTKLKVAPPALRTLLPLQDPVTTVASSLSSPVAHSPAASSAMQDR